MECQNCNGKGYKRCGFLWRQEKDCPSCHGTGRINWPAHAIRPGASSGKFANRMATPTKHRDPEPYSPIHNDSRSPNSDPLAAAIIAEAAGGDGLTAAMATGLTGDTTLGAIAGALDQDDQPVNQHDEVDRERGDSVEQSDSTDNNDSDDASDSSDSSDCGSDD